MSGKLKTVRFSLLNQINLIGLILLASFFICRNPSSKWDKTISGDGKSYYAYLTSALIYYDLDYKFVEAYEAKYYPPDQSLFKEFRQESNGEITNKTFPGITILWLPFFLLAHFLSYLFGFEADGYSLLYQYAIGMSAIFYVWLGLKWISQLLKKLGYHNRIILAVVISICLGTNLFYYTIYDPSLTHAYNFTLLAGMLYYTNRFYNERVNKYLTIAIALFAIAIITRPTNILMLLFLPFAFETSSDLKVFIKRIFSSKKIWLIIIGTTTLIAFYPIIWWYAQTGHFIVYSYGEEGFDFLKPHFFEILWSYEKGWLVYSPLILFSTLGLIQLFKAKKLLFFTAIIGFAILAYVFSCWWIWTYGASFGQRVFVDYYAIIAILLANGLLLISEQKISLLLWHLIAMLLIGLNLLQTYQFQNGILPTIGATKTSYWNSYFKLKNIKKSYAVDIPHIILKQFDTDFESKPNWMINFSTVNTKAYSGQFSQFISEKVPYSGSFKRGIPDEADFIQIQCKIFCENNNASPQLVYELSNTLESSYNAIGLMPYLEKYTWKEFFYSIDLNQKTKKSVNIYFWNPTQNNVWIDDLKIIFGKYR